LFRFDEPLADINMNRFYQDWIGAIFSGILIMALWYFVAQRVTRILIFVFIIIHVMPIAGPSLLSYDAIKRYGGITKYTVAKNREIGAWMRQHLPPNSNIYGIDFTYESGHHFVSTHEHHMVGQDFMGLNTDKSALSSTRSTCLN
jgi:hypothetical protein